MKYQFMPMFWGDFFANTLHLTAQEVGAYVLLIGHAWENSGTIVADRAQRIARVDNRHWRNVRAVLEPFFDIEQATEARPRRYVHRRVQREHANAAELSNKRKGAALQMHSKSTCKPDANAPPSTLQLHIENLTNGKGREAPQEGVVLPSGDYYRDKGTEYRSPPRKKSR